MNDTFHSPIRSETRKRRHKSFGVVLAGGGARGLAHVGVLRALNHLGYYPDAIVGVSMGAVVGATYSLNDNWYRDLVDLDVSRFPSLPKFETPGVRTLLKNLLLAERAVQKLYFGLGIGERTVQWGRGVLEGLTRNKDLQAGPAPVFTSATDMLTGEQVIIRDGNAVDAVYASSALAGILPPLELGPRILIDGGYSDVAPVDVIRKFGLDVVIAVDPSQHRVSDHPKNGFEVLLRSIEITQNAYAATQIGEADFILHPQFAKTVGIMDFDQKRATIAAGVQAVRHAALDLHKLLSDGQFASLLRSLKSILPKQ